MLRIEKNILNSLKAGRCNFLAGAGVSMVPPCNLPSGPALKNIAVNCLIPGWTMTERQLTLWVDDAARQTIKEKQCLPDAVYPQDVANMATWLGSDDSRMVTGQIMVVDGGWI